MERLVSYLHMGVLASYECLEFEPYSSIHSSLYIRAVRRWWTNFYLWRTQEKASGITYFGFLGSPRRVLFHIVEEGGAYFFTHPLYIAEPLSDLWVLYGYVEGYVADLPVAPLPGVAEDGNVVWSRLVVGGMRRVVDDSEIGLLPTDPPAYLVDFHLFNESSCPYSVVSRPLAKRLGRTPPSGDTQDAVEEFPGSGSLVGEVFRVVESDADYLRLVGRGGDVYLAWDFVLGTLDSGEWVLLGEDGLYLAERRGEEVVVKEPYHGSIFDVRGPPYAPYYPVVPVKWVREQLRRAEELARRSVGAVREGPWLVTLPVEERYLLKWPLAEFQWEFRVRTRLGVWNAEFHRVDCWRLCDRDLDPRPPWCS